MVGPGDSPGTYEPNSRQMSALANAAVYFAVGVPFEKAWMERIRAANPSMSVVDTAQDIPRRDGQDPHVWTNPTYARRIAARMRDGFVRLDPAHQQDYERDYQLLADDLAVLDRDIRVQLAPYSGRAFLVFHAAWGYFADAYSLRQIAIEAEGKEPGPRALAATIEEARRLGCGTVFVQPQFSRATAEVVARELGARIVVIDPLAEDYLANLRAAASELAEAFASS
jgi:zinc transport system substrate-binding protein